MARRKNQTGHLQINFSEYGFHTDCCVGKLHSWANDRDNNPYCIIGLLPITSIC